MAGRSTKGNDVSAPASGNHNELFLVGEHLECSRNIYPQRVQDGSSSGGTGKSSYVLQCVIGTYDEFTGRIDLL